MVKEVVKNVRSSERIACRKSLLESRLESTIVPAVVEKAVTKKKPKKHVVAKIKQNTKTESFTDNMNVTSHAIKKRGRPKKQQRSKNSLKKKAVEELIDDLVDSSANKVLVRNKQQKSSKEAEYKPVELASIESGELELTAPGKVASGSKAKDPQFVIEKTSQTNKENFDRRVTKKKGLKGYQKKHQTQAKKVFVLGATREENYGSITSSEPSLELQMKLKRRRAVIPFSKEAATVNVVAIKNEEHFGEETQAKLLQVPDHGLAESDDVNQEPQHKSQKQLLVSSNIEAISIQEQADNIIEMPKQMSLKHPEDEPTVINGSHSESSPEPAQHSQASDSCTSILGCQKPKPRKSNLLQLAEFCSDLSTISSQESRAENYLQSTPEPARSSDAFKCFQSTLSRRKMFQNRKPRKSLDYCKQLENMSNSSKSISNEASHSPADETLENVKSREIMKITSWNLDGAEKLKGFGLEFLKQQDSDIICLQNVGYQNESDVPSELKLNGYIYFWNLGDESPGIAVASKIKPLFAKVVTNVKDLRRSILRLDFPKFVLVCVLAPTAGSGLAHLQQKLAWQDNFHDYISIMLEKLDKPLIVAGSLHTSLQDIGKKYFATH